MASVEIRYTVFVRLNVVIIFISKFIKSCFNQDEIDDVCGGRWTAARNLIKKGRSKDETGLELISCRHAIGQMALNMFQGELFGYPLFLIKRLVEKNAPKYCFADVMCKLWGFIKRKEPGLALKTKPALSVMHAKGHSLNCQVIF